MPQVLAGQREPVLRTTCVGPVVMVAENRKHTQGCVEVGKDRPYRVDLLGRVLVMNVVARADDHIAIDSVCPGDHVANQAKRHELAIVQIRQMDDTETG